MVEGVRRCSPGRQTLIRSASPCKAPLSTGRTGQCADCSGRGGTAAADCSDCSVESSEVSTMSSTSIELQHSVCVRPMLYSTKTNPRSMKTGLGLASFCVNDGKYVFYL